MKKIVVVLLFVCMILSMNINAAEPTFLLDFGVDNADHIESLLNGNKNALDYEYVDDYVIYTASGNDPYIGYNVGVDDVTTMFWAKLRCKNLSDATSLELFGATDGRSLSGPECTHFDISSNDTDWKEYIIHIPTANVETANTWKGGSLTEVYWKNKMEWVRVDPMWRQGDDGSDNGGNMYSGAQIMVDYIAFFATEEDAIAFRDPSAEVETAETDAPVQEAETEQPKAPAAQTSDIASVAVAAAACALVTAFIVSKKKK